MLTSLDLVVAGVYLVGTIAVGLACRGPQRDADDYFTAKGRLGGRIGALLVGLSVAATLFSGISFLAYPAVIYRGGIVLFLGVTLVCMPVAYVVLRWFLRRYLGQGLTHPYESIERRFGPWSRNVASVMFLLMRVGWMAALIYAPTLAILAATGWSRAMFWPVILAIGLGSTFYTAFGGIRGVIVTDALQFVVIFVGIALTVGYALVKLPEPVGEAVSGLIEADRLNLLPTSLDPAASLTVWTVAIGVTVANLANYVGDQMSLQRYLAAGSTRSALHAFSVNIFGVIAVLGLLSLVGLTLFAFYAVIDDPALPAKTDRVFPYFVASQLPSGASGLLLAAILAATISSMTSGINALSATVTLDLLPRFTSLAARINGRRKLWFARVVSLVGGAAATLAAGFVSKLGTLYDVTQIILGVFAGPLLVVVLLSVSHWRLSGSAMLIGLAAGSAGGWTAAWFSAHGHLASLWTAPIAAGLTFVSPLVAARVWPRCRGASTLSTFRVPEEA